MSAKVHNLFENLLSLEKEHNSNMKLLHQHHIDSLIIRQFAQGYIVSRQ